MDHSVKSKILVSTSLKMVPFLERELTEAGHVPEGSSVNSVFIQGTIKEAVALCLRLRTATSVRWLVKSFEAPDVKELYNGLKLVPWEDYLEVGTYFSVTSSVEHPEIKNTMYANVVCKDAIADRFMHKFSKRPDSGSDRSKAVLFLFWKNSQVEMYLDLSGESLTKHGYRINPYKAPLQENLAAAIIMATRWNRESHFINPMCGSGTLVIEAALMATGKTLADTRSNFGFMHLKGLENVKEEIQKTESEKEVKEFRGKIIATDHDRRAIDAAKENAEKAGVGSLIEFEVCDFTETAVPEGEGIVLLNPPYGERLDDDPLLERTYSGIGDFFKKYCSGKTGYVFTGNLDAGKKIGLKAKRKIPFMNAKIDCRLLEFELYSGSKRQIKSGEFIE